MVLREAQHCRTYSFCSLRMCVQTARLGQQADRKAMRVLQNIEPFRASRDAQSVIRRAPCLKERAAGYVAYGWQHVPGVCHGNFTYDR